jgi:hypothetical protein
MFPNHQQNFNAEEEWFRSKIHFDGKLINEAINILNGCLDNMFDERLERFFFPTNERLRQRLVQLGLIRDYYII